MTFESKDSEIIFALSYKVIAVYMGLILIYIENSGFKSLLYSLFYSLTINLIIFISLVYKRFYLSNYLKNLLKIILSIFESLKSSRARSGIGKSRVNKPVIGLSEAFGKADSSYISLFLLEA